MVYGSGNPPPVVGYPAVLNNRDAVRYYQHALIALGFSVGPQGADGLWGDGTRRAIRSFEQRSGLTVDVGLLGPEVQRALQRNVVSVPAPSRPAQPASVPVVRPPVASEWDTAPITVIHRPDQNPRDDVPSTIDPNLSAYHGFLDNINLSPVVGAPQSQGFPWGAVAAGAALLTGVIAFARYYDEKKKAR